MSGRLGNAAAGVEVLAEQLARSRPGTVVHVEVRHDRRCSHWRGQPCDCRPEIVTRTPRGKERRL